MSRKIFVSYKYGDTNVRGLDNIYPSRARDYVDLLQAHLDINDHINKGEDDGEDLSNFKDETIASRLRDKIYDSSITIVLISKNMKEPGQQEEDQWIPWEISYSLREQMREGRISSTNAVLAVVIPDEYGSYEYFIQENTCSVCNCRTLQTNLLFNVLKNNMFNRKNPNQSNCNNHGYGGRPHIGDDHSYIYHVKWDDFIPNINSHINLATQIRENISGYNISKNI